MNDELHNDQDNLQKPNETMQTNVCPVCQMDPCVCPHEDNEPEPKTLDEDSKNDEKPTGTKPPKISWI